jgi:hypothetical protein
MSPPKKNVEKVPYTFGKFKKEFNDKRIIEKAEKMLAKDKKTTAEQIGKAMKLSKTRVLEAFDKRPPAEKKTGLSIQKAIDIGLKMVLGAGGMVVLKDPDKIGNVIEPIITELLNNKMLWLEAGGIWAFWNKIVVPKIKDEKNQLSELETLVKLLDSEVGKYGMIALLITIFGPPMWNAFVQYSNAVIQDLKEDEQKELTAVGAYLGFLSGTGIFGTLAGAIMGYATGGLKEVIDEEIESGSIVPNDVDENAGIEESNTQNDEEREEENLLERLGDTGLF